MAHTRFDEDGSPKSLKAFLDSTGGGLTFSFRPNGKSVYQSLEDDRDRRVLGTSTKYVMIDGKFDLPDDRPGGHMVEGKYTLAPLYHVKLNPEMVTSVGVVSGEKTPVITDRNPHLENLADSHRCFYLPYSDDANMVAELPNHAGLFFTTQRVTGGDIFVGYDRTLHKFWVVVINSVYSPETKPPDQGRGQEKLWRRLVEYQAYNDRVLDLLTRLGNHVKILFRLSCVPSVKENPASRLNDYFRDELTSEKDPDSCYYLYERSALLYGLFTDGSWQFGLKDHSSHNGVHLGLQSRKELKVVHNPARYPL